MPVTLTRAFATAALAALMLAGCGRSDDSQNAASNNAAAVAAPSGTLAAALDGNNELDTLHDLARNAGLDDVLGGVGPYTLFAPTDAAFEVLGNDRIAGLKGEAMRPQAIALLRAHLVPGLVTKRDLDAALSRAGANPVRMRTMSGGTLTFAREGEAIVVSAEGGARARLAGDEATASNGAIHPVDALLVSVEPASR